MCSCTYGILQDRKSLTQSLRPTIEVGMSQLQHLYGDVNRLDDDFAGMYLSASSISCRFITCCFWLKMHHSAASSSAATAALVHQL
jgi:hypothetical protein